MGLCFNNYNTQAGGPAQIGLDNSGSIPYIDPLFNGHLILSPMNVGFGLCGAISDKLDVYSWYPSILKEL